MITYKNQNILDETRGIIVHGCNASGGFGSGIAGQIRKRFPEVYTLFKTVPTGQASLGKLQIVYIDNDLYICNAFTQLHYGNDGKKYADATAIRDALESAFIVAGLKRLPLKSPKIGCGLGGLSWETEVLPIFEELNKKYENVDVEIFVYENPVLR